MSYEIRDFESIKNGARDACKGWDLKKLAARMRELQAMKEEQEALLNHINAWLDVIRLEAIPERMDEDGVTNIKFDGIGRITLTGDLYVSVKDKARLYDWLDTHGFGDIIQPTVNASTLKAFVKGRMKAGEDVPGDFLKITPFTRASITKA